MASERRAAAGAREQVDGAGRDHAQRHEVRPQREAGQRPRERRASGGESGSPRASCSSGEG